MTTDFEPTDREFVGGHRYAGGGRWPPVRVVMRSAQSLTSVPIRTALSACSSVKNPSEQTSRE